METYQKILVGRYFPESKCFVENDKPLIVRPKKIVKIKENIDHVFSEAADPTKTSIYGWVQDEQTFSFEDFCKKYVNRPLDENEKRHIDIMLRAISKLQEGTVVKVRYTERGILDRRMDLVIHKVFFY